MGGFHWQDCMYCEYWFFNGRVCLPLLCILLKRVTHYWEQLALSNPVDSHEENIAHLPSPRIPLAPLDRQKHRSFSTGSWVLSSCFLAWFKGSSYINDVCISVFLLHLVHHKLLIPLPGCLWSGHLLKSAETVTGHDLTWNVELREFLRELIPSHTKCAFR